MHCSDTRAALYTRPCASRTAAVARDRESDCMTLTASFSKKISVHGQFGSERGAAVRAGLTLGGCTHETSAARLSCRRRIDPSAGGVGAA